MAVAISQTIGAKPMSHFMPMRFTAAMMIAAAAMGNSSAAAARLTAMTIANNISAENTNMVIRPFPLPLDYGFIIPVALYHKTDCE